VRHNKQQNSCRKCRLRQKEYCKQSVFDLTVVVMVKNISRKQASDKCVSYKLVHSNLHHWVFGL